MHLAIDTEGKSELVAVAVGIRIDTVKDALKEGADIIVIVCAITKAKDVRSMTERFIEEMRKLEIIQYGIMKETLKFLMNSPK